MYFVMSNKKLNVITLGRKLEIIHYAEQNSSAKQIEIAKHFNLPATTINGILKKKSKYRQSNENDAILAGVKKIKGCTQGNVDKALHEWFLQARHNNMIIDGNILLAKATQLASSYACTSSDEPISRSWINRWKQRHDIQSSQLFGESAAVNQDAVDHWKVHTLQRILETYDDKDI